MKNIALSLILLLFTSACSHKTERAVNTRTSVGTPQFSIAPSDVVTTSVSVVTGRIPSSPTQETALVDLELSKAKAAELRQFTKDHLNQKVQIMVGTNVVEELVIRAEIPGPKLELMFSTPNEARSITNALSMK